MIPACSGGKHIYELICFYLKVCSETSGRYNTAWQYLVNLWSTFSFLRVPAAPFLFHFQYNSQKRNSSSFCYENLSAKFVDLYPPYSFFPFVHKYKVSLSFLRSSYLLVHRSQSSLFYSRVLCNNPILKVKHLLLTSCVPIPLPYFSAPLYSKTLHNSC